MEPANFFAAPAPDFFSKRLQLLVFFSSGSGSKEPKTTGSGSGSGSPALVRCMHGCTHVLHLLSLHRSKLAWPREKGKEGEGLPS